MSRPEAGDRRRETGTRGFTLVELMIALAIVGGVMVVLLDQRIQAVQDAQRIRDQRLGWTLAAWKMSALELDDSLLSGPDKATDAGTFEEYSPDYAGYVWSYDAERVQLKTNDDQTPDDMAKEVFKVVLTVRLEESKEPLVTLSGVFPVSTGDSGGGGAVK